MKTFITFFMWTLWVGPCLANLAPGSETKMTSVENKLREFIKRELQNKARVEVDRVFLSGIVPQAAEITSVEPNPPFGVINFELSWNEQGNYKQAFGTASSKVFLPVVVAKTAIRNNEPFTSENCSLKEKELTAHRLTGYYESLESMRPFRARGYITPGMVISYNQTQSPFIVNSGESVELVRVSPGIQISVRARAVESGREGQWIKVENLSNKKIVQAKVLSPGTVSVH